MYVLVSGLPGSGKSMLARPLAAALGLPLLARDEIKEALWDALGPGDVSWSRRLGMASGVAFYRLARDVCPAVLENFFHRDDVSRLRALAGPDFVEVHCACPPELARERYAARTRHPCHFDLEYGLPAFEQWIREDAAALGLGGPVIDVDTSTPVDVDAIAAWVLDVAPHSSR